MQEPHGSIVPQLPLPSADRPVVRRAIKILHTFIWAFFASCILALPIASLCGENRAALWLAAIVLVEVVVLALNKWRCPLTALVAQYTPDRRANVDIYA